MGKARSSVQQVRLRLVLEGAPGTTLCLEPWGDAYHVGPGATVELVASGPGGDSLELQVGERQVSVWGWPGATVRAFVDGTELGVPDGGRPPVPAVPAETTVRAFVEKIFAGQPTAENPPETRRRAAKASASS